MMVEPVRPFRDDTGCKRRGRVNSMRSLGWGFGLLRRVQEPTSALWVSVLRWAVSTAAAPLDG
jgi:hypothetical protein